MIDPDRLTITRKRRQEGRCVACGVRCGCQVLCDDCKPGLNYCPSCETTRPRTTRLTSSICWPCRRKQLGQGTMAAYQARRRAQPHAQLAVVVRLIRKGLTYRQIGERIGLTRAGVRAIVFRARQRGQWPNIRKASAT